MNGEVCGAYCLNVPFQNELSFLRQLDNVDIDTTYTFYLYLLVSFYIYFFWAVQSGFLFLYCNRLFSLRLYQALRSLGEDDLVIDTSAFQDG